MTLPIRGLLYDLARGQRAHLPYLQSVIDRLAGHDFNMIVLNLEHRFEFPSCPGIAPSGSLTVRDARRLVAFGRQRGIEVVAQPNLLGHCEGIAATERYAHLSIDPYLQAPWGGYEQLNLELPAARRLVTRMLADVCRAFPGPYLHVGCDEVRRLNLLYPDDPRRQLRTMRRHFGFILQLARRTGRQVMIWGDMLLQHPELLSIVPHDVIICDWHYGAEGSRATLRGFQCKGRRVLSCPAVPTYDSFLIDPDVARANITRMVGDARGLKLEGFLLTTWEFDFGCVFDTVWPWVGLAADVAAGRKPRPLDPGLARLLRMLNVELAGTLAPRTAAGFSLTRVRKLLFRAGGPAVARPTPVPGAGSSFLWEPSPFAVWLYLRQLVTPPRLRRLRQLTRRAWTLARPQAWPYRAAADALAVLTDRLEHLERARRAYHRAATGRSFRANLGIAIRELQALRPGLRKLKAIVRRIDARQGLDAEELGWLALHERSLDQHIAALRELRRRESGGDVLLEFGEFLRRPAGVTQRLTWR